MANTATTDDEDIEDDAEEFKALRAKLRDISNRLSAARTQPGYPEVFKELASEASEACGEKYGAFLEFLGPYDPRRGA